jgi:hypothetical protein
MCSDQVVQIRGIEPVKVCGIRQIVDTVLEIVLKTMLC